MDSGNGRPERLDEDGFFHRGDDDVDLSVGEFGINGQGNDLIHCSLDDRSVARLCAKRSVGALKMQSDGIVNQSAHTAGGQSGHFLSANFADLVDDWVGGKPTPFLAGAAVSRIVLEP